MGWIKSKIEEEFKKHGKVVKMDWSLIAEKKITAEMKDRIVAYRNLCCYKNPEHKLISSVCDGIIRLLPESKYSKEDSEFRITGWGRSYGSEIPSTKKGNSEAGE